MADSAAPQSYANHARYVPGFHGFVFGVLAINVIVAIVQVARAPGFFTAWNLLLALALVALALYARSFPLKAQDRVIRLEERLRLQQLLPEPLRARIPELTTSQLVALRFASDGEVAGLAEQTLAEGLTNDAIKRRIKGWRADYLRM